MSSDHQERYAGDVTAEEAWRILAENKRARLVDVRTTAEWNFVGIADLSPLGSEPVFLSWQVFPSMDVNADFVGELEAAGVEKDQTVLFICRSGARSRAAAIAATAHEFRACYNVSDGFEGDPDEHRHRGRINGWKASGLPWVQQ